MKRIHLSKFGFQSRGGLPGWSARFPTLLRAATPAAAGGGSARPFLWRGWREGSVYWRFKGRFRLFLFGGYWWGQVRTNSKRGSERIPPASFAPDFLRLGPRAGTLDHIRPRRRGPASFPAEICKKEKQRDRLEDPSSRTGHPQRRRRRRTAAATKMRMAALAAGTRVPPLRASGGGRDSGAGASRPPPDRGVSPA